MSKLLSAILIVTPLIFSQVVKPASAIAGTCASFCGVKPIEFIPGKRINVEVVNLTSRLLRLEKVSNTKIMELIPGEVLHFKREGNTEPNLSLVFWDAQGLWLKVKIIKPDETTLRIELRLGGTRPGDRSVYLKDDGRVSIF